MAWDNTYAFSNGLMAGFNFIEGIRQQRFREQQATVENERAKRYLGIYEDQAERARRQQELQNQYVLEDRQLAEETRAKTQEAGNVAAQLAANNGDYSTIEGGLERLTSLSPYNASIAAFLESGAKRAERDAAAERLFASQQAGAPAAGVAGQELPAGDQQQPTGLETLALASEDMIRRAPGSSLPPTILDDDFFTHADATRMVPVREYVGGNLRIVPREVPNDLQTEAEINARKDLSVQQKEAEIQKSRERFARRDQETAAAKQKEADVYAIEATYDVSNPKGERVRQMLRENPGAAARFIIPYWNSIKPAVQKQLASTVYPAAKAAAAQAGRKLNGLLATDPTGDRVLSSPEYRAARVELDQAIDLARQTAENWTIDSEMELKSEYIPLNNKFLVDQAKQAVANRPVSPDSPTTSAVRGAHTRVGRYENTTVPASGRRRVPKQVIKDTLTLIDAGVLSSGAIDNLLTYGTIGAPAKVEHQVLKPGDGLVGLVNGGMVVYREPDAVAAGAAKRAAKGNSDELGPNDAELLKLFTAAAEGDDKAEKERNGARLYSSFVTDLRLNGGALADQGFDVSDLSNLTTGEYAQLAERWITANTLVRDHDTEWFGLKALVRGKATDYLRKQGGVFAENSVESLNNWAGGDRAVTPVATRGLTLENMPVVRQQIAASPDADPATRIIASDPNRTDAEVLQYLKARQIFQ